MDLNPGGYTSLVRIESDLEVTMVAVWIRGVSQWYCKEDFKAVARDEYHLRGSRANDIVVILLF